MSGLVARMYGVIRRPRATFVSVLQTPSCAAVLIVTTAITFVCSFGFLSTGIGRQALVDQWERTAAAFGQTVNDAAYAQMEDRAEHGGIEVVYAAGTAIGYGPLLAFVVAGLLFVALRPRRPFVELLTIAAYSGVILTLRQVVSTPLYYIQESIASPTTLVRVFGGLDEASSAARFLGVIDLFVVWYIVVLAIGVSVASKRPTRRLALAFTGAYVVLALLTALVMAMSGASA